jgi:hypothetical protein
LIFLPELARNVLHLSKTPNHSEKNEKQAHDGDPVEPDADVGRIAPQADGIGHALMSRKAVNLSTL